MIGYVNLIMYLLGIAVILVVLDFLMTNIVKGITKLIDIIKQKIKFYYFNKCQK